MDREAEFIGSSHAIKALLHDVHQRLRKIAQADHPPEVLILGERGVGKSLLGELLHRRGPRRLGPFLKLNCATIDAPLADSELFGHERGAFTGADSLKIGVVEQADGGVLFLDEIAALDARVQEKLLTVIEEHTFRRVSGRKTLRANVWIIAATNADVTDPQRFRPDLLDRLSQIVFRIPPLRDRREDVVPLAERFLERACDRFHSPTPVLTQAARAALESYDWPGNARELANLMQDVILRGEGREITTELLGLGASPLGNVPASMTAASSRKRGPYTQRDYSEAEVRAAFDEAKGNVSATARRLGAKRNTIRYWIEKFALRYPRDPSASAATSASAVATEAPSSASANESLRWERRSVAMMKLALRVPGDPSPLWTARLLDPIDERIASLRGARIDVNPLAMVAVFGLTPTEEPATLAAQAALTAVGIVERDYQPRVSPEASVAIDVQNCLIARGRGGDQIVTDDRIAMLATLDRLLAQSAPSAVVVTEEVARAIRRRFGIAPVATDHGGGTSVYRIVGVRPTSFGVWPDVASPFVERDSELATLTTCWKRACEGAGQAVGISGTAGVGKSRLLHEFRSALPAAAFYLEGRCEAFGTTTPYLPIARIVRSFFGLREATTVAEAERRVADALADMELASEVRAPYLLHLLGLVSLPAALAPLSAEAVKARTVAVLRDILITRSRRRPIVMAVEDYHWIDRASAECLATVVDGVAGYRVLVVATYRSGASPPWLGKSYATQVTLPPLSPAASHTIARQLLRGRSLPEPLVDAMVARADGIPFFLEELILGALADPDVPGAGALPYTVQTALTARVDRLPAVDRRIVRAASVFGSDPPVAVLRDMTADVGDGEFDAAFDRLQANELLSELGAPTVAVCRFKHPLTHSAVHGSLLDDERRDLHARAAAAIQRCTPALAERSPEVLARHLTEAGHSAEASDAWLRAGQRAMQRCANVEALDHLNHGLRLVAELPESRARIGKELKLRLGLAQALVAVKGYGAAEVEHALSRAHELCDALDGTPDAVSIFVGLWQARVVRAEYAEARRLADRLHALAAQHGDRLGTSHAHFATGIPAFYQGDLVEARRCFQDARHAYEGAGSARAPSGQDPGVLSLGFLGIALALLGQVHDGTARADEGLALAREIGHPFTLASALHCVCLVAKHRRDGLRVARYATEELEIAQEYGFAFWIAGGLIWSGWAEVQRGDTAHGLALMSDGIDAHRATGARLGLPAYLADFAEACAVAGRTQEALAAVSEGIALAEHSDERLNTAELYRIRGELLTEADHGDAHRGEADLVLAVDIAQRQRQTLLELRAATSLALHRHRQGRRADAAALLERVLAPFNDGGDLHDVQRAQALRAGLTEGV